MLNAPESVREATISFSIKHIEKNGKLPSIGFLCDNKKGLEGLNRTKFYEAFPDGIKGLGEALGVDIPQERMDSTRKAREGKEKSYLKQDSMDELDVNSLMRLLGSKTAKQAGKEAVAFIAGLTSYSELKGVKPPEAWEEMQKEIDGYMDKNIRISLELDNWRWSNDYELAEKIGLNSTIMRQFNKARLKNHRIRLVNFLNAIMDGYLHLLRDSYQKDTLFQ